MTDSHPTSIAVVLAAGRGTRMRSERPKVLHEAAGRPLLHWVLDAAREAGCQRLVAVIGHGAESVRATVPAGDVEWVVQAEQLGTGHALTQAEPTISEPSLVLVLSGDVPLVRPTTLRRLLAAAREGFAAMAVARLERPGSLGRVLGDGRGGLDRIVEAADASPEELRVTLINAGLYALPAPAIFELLRGVGRDNAQGELYLTDAVTAAAKQGHRVALVELDDPDEAIGVNTRAELAAVSKVLSRRRLAALMEAGVGLTDPDRVQVGAEVQVGADTQLHADVCLLGATRVGRDCILHQGAWLRDCVLGDGVEILPYSVLDGATVGDQSRVGPFARLRPGARLGTGARVGNFVEIKNSELGPGAKASHLAYIGDTEVGAGANLGAGVVTCNYDGVSKHRTEIGAGAFVGSDTMLVAPVKVGKGATTAAGSVITRDVPDGGLGVGRARQRNVADWSTRPGRRPGPDKE